MSVVGHAHTRQTALDRLYYLLACLLMQFIRLIPNSKYSDSLRGGDMGKHNGKARTAGADKVGSALVNRAKKVNATSRLNLNQ